MTADFVACVRITIKVHLVREQNNIEGENRGSLLGNPHREKKIFEVAVRQLRVYIVFGCKRIDLI